LHSKNVELDTQLQVETRGRRNQEDANKVMTAELQNTIDNNRELQTKIEKSEQERLRMEAEARDSGEQLREMAEKVFQLLERLKLAELGKTKAMEALQKKEMEMIALKKKNSRLIKESTKEGKARVKAELDKKVLQDQIRALKKHNAQLSQRCREEVQLKLSEHEERQQAEEKVKTLGGRLSFLLNKMQADEESKVVRNEEMKKMEAQIKALSERGEELSRKVEETGESNRVITQAMRLKQGEVEELTVRCEALTRVQQDASDALAITNGGPETNGGESNGGGDDREAVKAAGGRGRFYMESKPSLGLVLLKGKKPAHRAWLEKHGVNGFLTTAQKTNRFKEASIERLAQVYALLMVEEEETTRLGTEIGAREEHIEHLSRKTAYLQDRLGSEEDAKRRTLLRYVNAVKAGAASQASANNNTEGLGAEDSSGGGAIQLPESGITDEEVHAIAALLRGNTSIADLNLRGNLITDEGARALSAVLGGKSALRSVDLRGNRVGKQGLRTIAEALERSARVRHVYVHAGGKIEALGTGRWANPRPGDADAEARAAPLVTVETVCVVDVRENTPSDAAPPDDLSNNGMEDSGMQPERNMLQAASNVTQAALPNSTQGEGKPSKLKVGGQGKKKKESSAPLSAKEESLRAAERAREKAHREKLRQEEQRARDAEARWEGRAGGLELRLPALGNGNSRNEQSETRLSSPPMGARSAPMMGSIDSSLSENPLMPRTLGGSGGARK